MLQNLVDDLKQEFAVMTSAVGLEYSVFSDTRQREVLHSVDRLEYYILPDLQTNYIDVSDFKIVFYGIRDLVDKIYKLQKEQQTLEIKESIEKLYYNLKTLINQTNSQVQEFYIP